MQRRIKFDLIEHRSQLQLTVCYERPQFAGIPITRDSDSPTFYRLLLAVLIFALLGYVVFRSTRKQKVEEPEPELSVCGGYFSLRRSPFVHS